MKKLFLFLIILTECSFELSAQTWQIDWQIAQKEAQLKNKELILVFSGSDWCIPCIKLEKEIWSDPIFIQFAKDHYILFRADFPKRKKNKLPASIEQLNNELAESYNTKGYFPLVVVFNPDGSIKGQLGYEKVSPEEYIEWIEKL